MSKSHSPIVLFSSRPWHKALANKLEKHYEIIFLSDFSDLTYDRLKSISPQWIFILHCSHYIPDHIFTSWNTVVFHMTDLPFGRGGSPLQNLIKLGYDVTQVSAIQCAKELDSGDIYLKKPLSLLGTAEEIFMRSSRLLFIMIREIIDYDITPIPQVGTPTHFKRRVPAQSSLADIEDDSLESWYDHIRMLDAESYPHAFITFNGMKLEFRRASLRADGLYADVKIIPLDQ